MILNISKLMKEEVEFYFDAGGWIKELKGIDESKENGYKYEGDFLPSRALSGLYEFKKGIYIVCSLEGSRRKPRKYVRLIKIDAEGVHYYGKYFEGYDWALQLLPLAKKVIEEEKLSIKEKNELEAYSDKQLISELKRRGIAVDIEVISS
jgi:hypothetical protein